MKKTSLARAGMALLCAPCAWLVLVKAPAATSTPPAQEVQPPLGGLVTLYAADDLASSFDFRSGTHGAEILEGEVHLERAQIVFDVLEPNSVSYGFAQDELVRVIDLGAFYVEPHVRSQDAALKFSVSAFHTLFMDGARFSYVEAGGKATRHRAGNPLLAPMVEDGLRSFEPIVGHTYLIRFQGRRRGGSDQVAKFQVIDIEPRRKLTFRWAPVGEM